MNYFRPSLVVPVATAIMSLAQPMLAANTRSWVSHNGSDANACTIAAPCLTFQRAHDVTLPGGEVDAMDPADYGELVINKAITIDGGNMAYIMVNSTQSGITVLPIRDSLVVIRNLSINNLPNAGSNAGIFWDQGGYLHIENVSVTGVNIGIQMGVTATQVNPKLFIKDTTVRNCPGAGILVQGTTKTDFGVANVELNNVTVAASAVGINLILAKVNAVHTVVAGSSNIGVETNSGTLNLEDSSVTGSATGLLADLNSTIRIASDNIHDNVKALETFNGGQIVSFGTNRIAGNQSLETPSNAVALK